jgi:hypothetical protein
MIYVPFYYWKLLKESLNSDGQQFHQYKQANKQQQISSQIIYRKVPRYTTLQMQGLAWNRQKQYS